MNTRYTSGPMEYTGERMVPESSDQGTFWEHIRRYKFARKFVNRRRVLDVACGEGYGSFALLKAGASGVTGVDISPETCLHAASKYGIDAVIGDAVRLPFPDASFEVIVSFETIEHIQAPERFLDECLRLLIPGGRLIISTPNRDVYSEHGQHNPFHLKEMNEEEFVALLKERFPEYRLYSQGLISASRWSLRSLAASKSPWSEVKGYWMVRRWFHPRGLEAGNEAFNATSRKSPERAILSGNDVGAVLFDPFVVRPRSVRSAEKFEYLIAIADKRTT